ncbi:uncharacterized protein K02A2.6-like [Polypterus senegalus]|uniref:uncharacterized protein K02A2.6-like n=1 Tax=Polypterus senegalus TaxID=55291 RepID=UPI00196368BA|nr:uncharacterized protein K02A2.6-like [Polypterus senegalus]
MTYSKTHIPVVGCLSVTVCLHGRTTVATFFVVEDGTPLMGRDLLSLLHVHIVNNKAMLSDAAASTLPVPVLQCTAVPFSIGCVKNFIHRIKIDETVPPVRQKLRRLPLSVTDAVSEELDRLLSAGVIERIDASAWVSPIVVTQRKSGNICMCIDLRKPNRAVIVDSFPLPHMDELLSALRGATVFSTIDLASACYQVPLHEDSRDLTAFITHEGLFRFCRVPYGLASAPSAFQKMMTAILAGLPGVENYLDDVIVHGPDLTTHDKTLHSVLCRLEDAGLQLNNDKCKFRQSSLPFLGHIVSADGLLPDKAHVQAIMNAPAPTDTATLRSYLGLLSWYSKFLPNHATVIEPMRTCLRQPAGAFQWMADAQKSFEQVKTLLVDSPVLALFDPTLHTVVSTDASDYGLGAILSQLGSDNVERTVAFASQTLSTTERKYSIVEKEALACAWAIKKWRTYLWGRRFTLRTDHQALTTLLTTKGIGRAGMRIARWSACLLSFNYDVIYRPGSQNAPADCLSRLPLPVAPAAADDAEPEFVALLSVARKTLSPADLESACAECPDLTKLHTQIVRDKLRLELSVSDNFVFHGSRLIVLASLCSSLIAIAHESHQGVVCTKQRLRELYWWPKMDTDVCTAISSCQTCQMNDKTTYPHPAPLQPTPFSDGPWEKVALDIVGPFDTAAPDCRYALTLIDYHSKWPEVTLTSSITTANVLTFLSSIFSHHGNPTSLVTDNEVQFTSAAFAAFLEERQIKHHRSSLHYPAANGAVERFNHVLKHTIQLAIQEHYPWKAAITDFLHIYCATPHATTGVSPFELLHGRQMRTKLTILPPTSSGLQSASDVRTTVEQHQNRMKVYTDAKRGARLPSFKTGDKVRVRNPLHVPKGHQKFSNPVTINKKLGAHTYILSDGKTWNASHLVAFPDCASTPAQKEVNPPELPQSPRPKRSTHPPNWLKDYVT